MGLRKCQSVSVTGLKKCQSVSIIGYYDLFSIHIVLKEVKSFIYHKKCSSDRVPLSQDRSSQDRLSKDRSSKDRLTSNISSRDKSHQEVKLGLVKSSQDRSSQV